MIMKENHNSYLKVDYHQLNANLEDLENQQLFWLIQLQLNAQLHQLMNLQIQFTKKLLPYQSLWMDKTS